MPIKKRAQRFKSSKPIFDSGGCKGLENKEIFSALLGTKRANYLVFHFDHTEITFRLIVGKRNEGIICKTTDVSLVFNKAINQGANGAFLRFSSFSLFLLQNGILPHAPFENLIIMHFQAFHVMLA